jgi:hypothetical protein
MSANHSLVALVLILGLGSAQAADYAAPSPHRAMVSADTACAGSGVLGRIKGRYAYAERNVLHRGFLIASIGNPRPSGHRYAEPGLVKRDYCRADAVMTNGSAHPVFYVIEHGLGFAGIGRDIDFCVPGLDPWHVHDGDCRTVR